MFEYRTTIIVVLVGRCGHRYIEQDRDSRHIFINDSNILDSIIVVFIGHWGHMIYMGYRLQTRNQSILINDSNILHRTKNSKLM